MDKSISIQTSINIQANKMKIWDALVNPEKIKIYLFGTETISDWTQGSSIIFQGDYQGQKYKDKGIITAIQPGNVLEYLYWTGFSGLEDKEENYALVRFSIEDIQGACKLSLLQKGFVSQQASDHSLKSWEHILLQIKDLAEKQA